MSEHPPNWKPWVMGSLYGADEKSAPEQDKESMSVSFRHEAELQMIKQKAHDDAFEAGFASGIKAGHQKGYAQGYEKGEQAAQEEVWQRAQEQLLPLASLANDFSQALQSLDSAMVEQLAQMAMHIGTALARRQLDVTPQAVCDLVKDLLSNDHAPMSKPVLWLHPDDLSLVKAHLGESLKNGDWTICPDATLSRGGCKVTSKTGEIDAQFETRVNNMVRGLFS